MSFKTPTLLCGICLLIFTNAVDEDEGFVCWPESERTHLTFVNSNRSMEHLPTIRFIQGYWGSQWALQYVGYLYLKEKMGLNVQFFPKLSSGLTLDDLSPYPDFYWRNIADDNYDLLLEQWQVTGMEPYYDEGSVIFGGINEIYGQIGQFVPDYVYDELLIGTLPIELKYNSGLRTKFIEGYTNKSSRDWVQWLNDTLYSDNETMATYLDWGFGLPSYDKPIMWGSKMTYIMSEYTHNITQRFQIWNDTAAGLDWIFCPLLTEAALSEFVIDLYEKKQPFIANLYTPHPDFATLSTRTGEFMRWEHIFIHRNVDNSRAGECFVKAQCQEPFQALYKLGNPLLSQRVPEMLAFLYGFNLLADHLYTIIYERNTLDARFNDAQMSSHQKWLNATCGWLRQHESIMSEFHQDIVRYDCLSGCGFDYYYAYEDSVEIKTFTSDVIGGYCANSSIAPQCVCVDPYLTGEDCRTHCDGLLGPYYDATNESYHFTQCNGNGACDISRQKCSCFEGYSGDGCEIVFQQFEYNTTLQILFLTLFALCIVMLLLSVVWLWVNQKYKTVKVLSAKMTTLFTVGLILLCVGTILYLYHPLNDVSCNARNFCYGLGAILTILAPLCKTYRVSIIFAQARNMKRIKIPDTKLLVYLINGVIIEFCICCVYTILHEVNGGAQNVYLSRYNRIEMVCNQSETVKYIESANYLYIFTLIIILCFFSFKNRKSHKLFKESKCAFFGSFFSLFVFLVAVVFNIVVEDRQIIVTIQACAMLIALAVIWTLFYGVRLYQFKRYPEKRNLVDLSTTSKQHSVQITAPPSMQTAEGSAIPPSNQMNYSSSLIQTRNAGNSTSTDATATATGTAGTGDGTLIKYRNSLDVAGDNKKSEKKTDGRTTAVAEDDEIP